MRYQLIKLSSRQEVMTTLFVFGLRTMVSVRGLFNMLTPKSMRWLSILTARPWLLLVFNTFECMTFLVVTTQILYPLMKELVKTLLRWDFTTMVDGCTQQEKMGRFEFGIYDHEMFK